MRNPQPSSPLSSPPFLAIAFLSLLGALLPAASLKAQPGAGSFAAFPSQSVADARFLSLGCSDAETMEQGTRLELAVPAAVTAFTLNVFDGDTATVDVDSRRHWDLGSRQLKFSLYADPLRAGGIAPENLIGEWFGNDSNATGGALWTASAATMPDNAWWTLTVTPSSLAQAPSGNYFYHLVIETDGACLSNESLESNFKIAVSDPVTFQLSRFGVIGEICQSVDDVPLAHPGGSVAAPLAAYVPVPVAWDGTFELYLSVPAGLTELRLFDGDFDFGTEDLTAFPSAVGLDACVETDDPDTDSGYAGFPFLTPGALPEGAAGPGSPPDDNPSDDLRRGEPGDPNGIGCVRYEVTDPESNTYFNDNPSGTAEWEQFLIASAASPEASGADHVYDGATLPAGIWKVQVIGLDLANATFWSAPVCSTRPAREALPEEDPNSVPRAAACPELPTYLVGEVIWGDDDSSGEMDSGESGIAGVLVELLRSGDGSVITSTRTGDSTNPNWESCVARFPETDFHGLACFGMQAAGEYEIRIAKSNFGSGEVLDGDCSTTGGEAKVRSLAVDNSIHQGFGYMKPGAGTIGGHNPR